MKWGTCLQELPEKVRKMTGSKSMGRYLKLWGQMLCIIFSHAQLGVMEHTYWHMASLIFLKYGIKRDSDMRESPRRNQGLRQGKSSVLDCKNCFLVLLSGIHRPHLGRFIRGDPLKRKSRAEELGIIPMRTPEETVVKYCNLGWLPLSFIYTSLWLCLLCNNSSGSSI